MPQLSAQVVDSEPRSVLMDTYQGVIIRGNAGGRSVLRLIRWGYSKASVLAMWDWVVCAYPNGLISSVHPVPALPALAHLWFS